MIDLDLLRVLTQKDLRVRYRSALLGYLWAAASPLIFAAIYFVAFRTLGVRRPAAGWGGFLLGVAVWQWTAGAYASSVTLYARNSTLLRRIAPRWTNHVTACVLCEAAPVAAVLPLGVAIAVAQGSTPSFLAPAAILFLAAAQTAALTGWASAAAAVSVVVRDLERLTGPLTTALFFLTPVAFDRAIFPAAAQAWLAFNPAFVFVEAWRAALAGTLDMPLTVAAALHAAFGIALTAAVERLCAPRLAEYA
ncbi:MAG: ABC transporter permease [Elusimicrobia bacterium]|nr:ABC transporter permease [Elusimicrobiota bacterium]